MFIDNNTRYPTIPICWRGRPLPPPRVGVPLAGQDVSRHAVEEVPVVGHAHHTPPEVKKRVLEGPVGSRPGWGVQPAPTQGWVGGRVLGPSGPPPGVGGPGDPKIRA